MPVNKLVLAAVLGLVAGLGALFILRSPDVPDRAGFLLYDDAVTIAAGEILYQQNCAVCHGVNLEGDPDWRSPDADGMMRPPPHDEDGHTWHHSDDVLFELTKFGTAAYVGGDYQSNMMGFGVILTDEQIAQTLAYIKSTWSSETIEIQNEINESTELAN